MALRISKIDYEKRIVTFEGTAEGPPIPQKDVVFSLDDGSILRIGMVVEGDGIDENGMFINPRRVR